MEFTYDPVIPLQSIYSQVKCIVTWIFVFLGDKNRSNPTIHRYLNKQNELCTYKEYYLILREMLAVLLYG